MKALSPEQRARHHSLALQLRPVISAFEERSDGYAACLSAEAAMILAAAEFITLERLCCPFLAFGIKVESRQEMFWLTVTGQGDIKPFIRAEFSIPIAS